MRSRHFRIALALLLPVAYTGCDAARRLHRAATYRVVDVPTAGMAPTINPGDRAAVDLTAYVSREAQRFDIIVFKATAGSAPEDGPAPGDDTVYVMRVIGLGGETVAVRGGRVYVNGRQLEEPFETIPLDPREEFGPLVVPPGEYFVLGDNRPNSSDSRYWKSPTLKSSQVGGKVVEILRQ